MVELAKMVVFCVKVSIPTINHSPYRPLPSSCCCSSTFSSSSSSSPSPPITKAAPPPSAPQLPLPNQKSGVRPPPPSPNAAFPTHQVQGNSRTKQPPNFQLNHFISLNADGDKSGPKTKLKPFFWDKVLANSRSNVWSHIRSGSFQFDEEMIKFRREPWYNGKVVAL